MPRTLPTAAYVALYGGVMALWFAALMAVWNPRNSLLAEGLGFLPLYALLDLAFRARAERKSARREGRLPLSLAALLARPTALTPAPRLTAYLGNAALIFAVGALTVFCAAVLFRSPTFPFFTAALPLLVAHALLRPLLEERDPLGFCPGRGLHQASDPH